MENKKVWVITLQFDITDTPCPVSYHTVGVYTLKSIALQVQREESVDLTKEILSMVNKPIPNGIDNMSCDELQQLIEDEDVEEWSGFNISSLPCYVIEEITLDKDCE